MSGILFGALLGFLFYIFVIEPIKTRRERPTESKENKSKVANCRKAPKGYVCTYVKDHLGTCEAVRERGNVHFLRRNETGQLERLVTDGKWVGWVSAQPGTRFWYVWQAIARARGI